MKRTIFVLLGALGLLAPAVPANEQPKATLASLAWMTGTWKGTDRGTAMEELWTDGQGGLMLGLHRDIRAARAVSFEFLRIEETSEGLVYQASPRGAPATPFPLIELGAQRAVFANPQHDFPKRIVYWLDAQAGLHAKVDAGEGTKGQEWRWERVR
jgi:Domain of unknown function (DUF6265)